MLFITNNHEHNTKAGIMKSIFKVIAMIIGTIAVLGVIGTAIALSMGYLHISVKQPTESVVATSRVCDDKVIDAYNVLVVSFPTNEADQKAKSEKIQQQLSNIKEKSDYDQDPTCLFIAYRAALDAEDTEAAEKNLNAIKKLADNGSFPSNELFDIVSIDSMEARVEALKNPEEPGTNPMGSG